MPLLETSERLARDKKETRERLERDGAMADGLTQTNEIACKSLREQERDGAMADGLTQTNKIASQSQTEQESLRDGNRGNQRELEPEEQLEREAQREQERLARDTSISD